MTHLTPNEKHNILLIYSSINNKHSFESLAHQYTIKGGGRVIQNWYHRWNGTPQSLERMRGSGRPSLLTAQQVNDYIRTPIRNKNRSSKPVHYPQIRSSVERQTGKQISLRTVQNYGKQKLGVKQKHTKKRTAQESKHTYHTHHT
jgi:transposase